MNGPGFKRQNDHWGVRGGLAGNVLSLASCSTGTPVYSKSPQAIIPGAASLNQFGSVPEAAEGQESVLSSNGKWLAFNREEQGRRTAWLQELGSRDARQTVLPSAYQPLDLRSPTTGM